MKTDYFLVAIDRIRSIILVGDRMFLEIMQDFDFAQTELKFNKNYPINLNLPKFYPHLPKFCPNWPKFA